MHDSHFCTQIEHYFPYLGAKEDVKVSKIPRHFFITRLKFNLFI